MEYFYLFVAFLIGMLVAATIIWFRQERFLKSITFVSRNRLTHPTIDVEFYEWYKTLKDDKVIQSWEQETRLVKGCLMHGFAAGRTTLRHHEKKV